MTWLGDQLSCVQNSFISPCREFKAYVGAYISLTFSKVLLAAQQLQRTSLRISYGKPKTGVLVGRPTIFTRSGQARQMRLIECWFHWWLNCQSLSRVRWHLYVSFYATWQQPWLRLCAFAASRSSIVFFGGGMSRVGFFWLPKQRITSFCSPGDGPPFSQERGLS